MRCYANTNKVPSDISGNGDRRITEWSHALMVVPPYEVEKLMSCSGRVPPGTYVSNVNRLSRHRKGAAQGEFCPRIGSMVRGPALLDRLHVCGSPGRCLLRSLASKGIDRAVT